jgi:hypothetical protein
MNNDWKPTEINEGQPTNWEPRKQHPEEVADGLRNAFRQAIKDGVMDATPYLKQMNSNKEIELLKQEIKMLKSKLSLLEEIEKHKSPVEEAYKDWWGNYPQLETDSEYDEMRWQGFQAGFQAAYEEKVRDNDKSQPRMEAERSGEVHIVFYNKKTYYRIEYTDEYGYVVWWRREKQDDTSRLVMVTDKETERLLEGLWFNEVKGGKYD